jgi:hypothetical protein
VETVNPGQRLALLIALVAGCGTGADPVGPHGGGTPGTVATVEFMLRSGGDLGSLPAPAGGLTVQSVAFWIDRLSLSGDRGGDHEGQDETGGQLLDLTGGPVEVKLTDVAPALYSRLRVDFGGSEDHGGPAIFEGMPLSYRVAGTTATGTPFVLRGSEDFRIDLRMVDGAELGAHTGLVCVVRLDMGMWFDQVPLPAPGAPAADPDQHEDQLPRFLANVVKSASMILTAVDRR